jgi:uncharacterized repeat protein (TIGR03803 family)
VIYGTAINTHGFVYQLTPPASGVGLWTFKNLHAFNGTDGDMPTGRLLLSGGKLFGSTDTPDPNGTNDLFELTPPAVAGKAWGFSVVHLFSTAVPDRGEAGGLLLNKAGQLVGVAEIGGPSSNGTVFAMTPPAKAGAQWVETVLHAFNVTDGLNPVADLLQDTDGTLYGTTTDGGAHNYGSVFQLTPPAAGKTRWTLKTLYSFTGLSDTGFPQQKLAFDAAHQHLYGISNVVITGQSETVFSLTRPSGTATKWTYSLIHTFAYNNVSGNYYPQAVVVIDNAIYGTTKSGGQYSGGMIYRLSPPTKAGGAWTETIMHSFTNGPTDGATPGELTVGAQGILYGTTISGGPSGDAGGAFSFKP